MNFWKRLCGKGCAHRFTWPRIDADGCHYQICLLCGTAYAYDWTMMRRTSRLMVRSGMVDVLDFLKSATISRFATGNEHRTSGPVVSVNA
jgi:hypothetical protein